MAMHADVLPIKTRCALSIRLGDDNVALFHGRSNLCFANPFRERERCVPRRKIEEELVEVLYPSLGACADVFGLTVGSDGNHLMQTVGVPNRSECDLCRSVKLWFQAPRTEDLSRFEEEPEKVVPFPNTEVSPLSFEECKGLFRVDLVGRAIDA